ncbi:MAG TPA: branched-chain amino acid ABC transporter permease [Firmicutes bacterium]|nr:branched-chain amino acid ABC transporter permease [Candidatus Fermentithermobacillaceae bacterium]
MQLSRYWKRDIVILLVAAFVVAWANGDLEGLLGIPGWQSYTVRIINMCAINTVLALSLNLVNGFTGQFSLGHAGFMALGAYTTALLTMSAAAKDRVFFMTPLVEPLRKLTLPFLPSLILAGLVAGVFSLVVGVPALRLRGDYLGIATLGFAEIIRLVIQNARSVTNGALGLKGIPPVVNLWWTLGAAVLCYLMLKNLISSSYGRAFKSIRENEIAAQAMGIDLFKHKLLAFFISSFWAGVGGGLLASLLTTIDPVQFKFPLTFQVLLMVVLGGMGSLSGSVISATIVTYLMEFLRVVEETHYLGSITIPGVPGLRMVIFSLTLVLVVVWYPKGLMGDRELSAEGLKQLLARFRKAIRLKGESSS